MDRRQTSLVAVAALAVLVGALSGNGGRAGAADLPAKQGRAAAGAPLGTTLEDFFQPGTQPGDLTDNILTSLSCASCHGGYDDGNPLQSVAPYDLWVNSMMGQSARDPVWRAAVEVANADANFAGETCIRCHSPKGWLEGRSVTGDPANLLPEDEDGVTCHVCHRLVDPIGAPQNPVEDVQILADLVATMDYPDDPGNARYIVDPIDSRRGPFNDVPMNFHDPAEILVSPFHQESLLCASCHDVSNPVYTRQTDGTYALNANDAAHPTQLPHDMVPEQRTYSEWLHSAFASGGVTFADNRFGGDHPTGLMQSCQDCHMPQYSGGLCVFWPVEPFFSRPYISQHAFHGGNTWVLDAVRTVDVDGDMNPDYPDFETGLSAASVADAQLRTEAMLQAASDLQLRQVGDEIKVRVINMTGHKLPTGYPEGRRMWINVQFFDGVAAMIGEHGFYDFATADLTTGDTKVYEAEFGVDSAASSATGVPVGPSFHLAVNNVLYKDNRIPPMGFTNAAYEAIRAAPVAATYDDGQHWDDTVYAIPSNAVEAVVTVYFQTSSKEYMEFLRDSNGGTNAWGQAVHTAWMNSGMSAPVVMDSAIIPLVTTVASDVNNDTVVDVSDLLQVLADWGPCPPPDACLSDTNCDGNVDVTDLLLVLAEWG